MTIDEAINQLESFCSWFAKDHADRDLQSIKLGIEALKRVKAIRDPKFPIMGEKLPGETDS